MPHRGVVVFVMLATFASISALLIDRIYDFYSSIDFTCLLAFDMADLGFLDDRLDLAASCVTWSRALLPWQCLCEPFG